MLKLSSKVTKCITLGLALNLVGCQTNLLHEVLPQNTNSISGRLEQTVKSYSGEELFRGIFMAEGEVANKLSIFDKMPIRHQLQQDSKLQQKYKKEVDVIMEVIEKEHPEFFSNFQKDITSGNITIVEKTIKNGAKILIETLKPMPKYEKIFAKVNEEIDVAEITKADGTLDTEKLQAILDKQKLEESFNPQCAIVTFEFGIYVLAVMDFGIVWNIGVLINVGGLVNVWLGTNTHNESGDFICRNVFGGGGGTNRDTHRATSVQTTSDWESQSSERFASKNLAQEMFLAEVTATFKQ